MNEIYGVHIRGEMETDMEYSHTCKGKKFVRFSVAVERDSGNVDHVQCVMPMPKEGMLYSGNRVDAVGDIRMYRLDKRKIAILYVSACTVPMNDDGDINIVSCDYNFSHVNNFFVKHDGRRICNAFLESQDTRKDMIPVVFWGKNAENIMANADRLAGKEISVYGRLQTRDFKAHEKTYRIMEISIQTYV